MVNVYKIYGVLATRKLTIYMEEDENIILTVTDFKSKSYIAEDMKHMISVY